jgi:hypothetical protein
LQRHSVGGQLVPRQRRRGGSPLFRSSCVASVSFTASKGANQFDPAFRRSSQHGSEDFLDELRRVPRITGQPSQWGTRNFNPRVPQFADNQPYLSAQQIFVAINDGIRYSGMRAWNGMLSDEEIWKVATFIEHSKHSRLK